MARPQKPLANMNQHLTKAEIEAKQNKEKNLEEFDKLSNEPPEHLNDIAKGKYRELYTLLEKLPMAQLDMQNLVSYCELYVDYLEISDEMKRLKKMIEVKYDLSIDKQMTAKRRQRLEVLRELKMLGNLLGMSIESRMRLVPADTGDNEDPIAQIFGDNNE